MKKSLLISGLIGVIALTSCSSNLNTDNKTSNKETTSVLTTTAANTTTTVTITSTYSIDTTTITSKEKTDEEKREEVINKANAAIESLSDNNFTAKTGNDVYLIDGNNCIKNNIIYEKNTDNYNVYTLIDEEEQSYTKEEITDDSFAAIKVGAWENIFTIADDITVNRVDTKTAYVRAKESLPEFELTYTTNGFIFLNENDSIEFYDIGKTEVNIPTNIVQEEYIIKDGKYNLTNLKAVLEKWFNETNITYQKVFRNVKDIKLINVDNEGLKIYATTDIVEENNLALSILSFKDQDINDLFINKTELNADDFSLRLEKVTAKQLTFKSAGLVIDNSDTKESVCRRAENVLVKDEIDAKVIWAFETGKLNGNMTYGDGLTYKMACFCKDGNYYEYEVNALGKSYVENNITNKFDVEQKTKLSVLQENFDLYEEK